MIRIILTEAVRRLVVNTNWLLSLAKKAEKMKVKGPRDLASNIDKYLYGS
jgi:hypothetical protein